MEEDSKKEYIRLKSETFRWTGNFTSFQSIKIVKSWDAMPPIVYDGIEAFSTRILERNYREMERVLKFIASQTNLTGNLAVELAKNILKDLIR